MEGRFTALDLSRPQFGHKGDPIMAATGPGQSFQRTVAVYYPADDIANATPDTGGFGPARDNVLTRANTMKIGPVFAFDKEDKLPDTFGKPENMKIPDTYLIGSGPGHVAGLQAALVRFDGYFGAVPPIETASKLAGYLSPEIDR